MAKGYWRVQRYQVFYGEQSSVYASTEKQAVKLAKKLNGTAIECDGGRVVYPLPEPMTTEEDRAADAFEFWVERHP